MCVRIQNQRKSDGICNRKLLIGKENSAIKLLADPVRNLVIYDFSNICYNVSIVVIYSVIILFLHIVYRTAVLLIIIEL